MGLGFRSSLMSFGPLSGLRLSQGLQGFRVRCRAEGGLKQGCTEGITEDYGSVFRL